ncbi:MAG: thiamine biosynthesis protein-like protein [Candidatus Moranbacteria bacterium GW2011_GWC1_45_18]|nr:MAG: hypothetical protein UT79_C0001G0445 [Candidatus Moranbacteria bacterium GW2011_GWC2_40_12]KKT32539.1 MAG: hypothetical protein UW19_C0019G0023 [Candidatus Moranbacteria bacterium GW2011_GWF2_44_10]KKT72143.1 MAG: hypothetical protein UW66_C0012G0002 [Candidatus Moranbacteria bacterium GW2011_GWF1_44_4]KKT99697.1 MAG: thiamine biosynthesis protein-like protein [Candidatus Moranbacteria bacterium GW2011_GWC1_45_18]OGI35267.1 MAG: hypothetical protein A2407_01265 [Candidatus Moranbacteria
MKSISRKVCALLLFSGGLDSILAAKILEKQGIEVTALTFVSYFFDAGQARKSAKENGIKLIEKDISRKHFEIVKNPRFGRGTGMNPCIDCHLLMLREAKKIALKKKYDFIATGEVLGQRPMSQNIEALKLIEREAGLIGKIIRPLSEKILNPRAELLGKMHGISGRGRKEQMALANKYGIKNYPTPAGGCILTDKEYSKKLSDLVYKIKKIKESDLKLLRLGRHFWTRPVRKSESLEKKDVLPKGKISKKFTEPKLSRGVKIILGRNHKENLALKKLAERNDLLVELKDIPGPLALVRGKDKKAIEVAKKKIIKYAKKLENKNPDFVFFNQKSIS